MLKVINSIEDETEFILGFKYSRSGGALTKSLYLFFATYKSAPVRVELSRSQNSGPKRAWLPTVHCPTSGNPPGSEVFSENLFWLSGFSSELPLGAELYPSDRRGSQCWSGFRRGSQSGSGGAEGAGRQGTPAPGYPPRLLIPAPPPPWTRPSPPQLRLSAGAG